MKCGCMPSCLVALLLFVTVNVQADKLCSVCTCTDEIADCSNKNLNNHFNASDWPSPSEGGQDLKVALFDHNNLVHILPFPALNITKLSLSHNRIAGIDDNAFQNLTYLKHLDLSYNQLRDEHLSTEIFRGNYLAEEYLPLHNLEVLNLGGNALRSIQSNTFQHLPHIKTLILEKNEFHVLDIPTIGALSSLTELQVLNLAYNEMKEFPDTLLHTLQNIQNLSLEGNELTTVPAGLANSFKLQHLILNNNPIKKITSESFSRMKYLKTLHLCYMPELTAIEEGGLSQLIALEEFHCHNNEKLKTINLNAFSRREPDEESEEYPPLKKIWINNNNIEYLDPHVVARWDLLDVLDLQANPWMCDCENQWMVSTLAKVIEKKNPSLLDDVMCGEPVEMRGRYIRDLEVKNYQMRCLDADGAHPENDGVLLVGILVGVLVAVPLTLGALFCWRRGRQFIFDNSSRGYTRAFYKDTTSNEDDHY